MGYQRRITLFHITTIQLCIRIKKLMDAFIFECIWKIFNIFLGQQNVLEENHLDLKKSGNTFQKLVFFPLRIKPVNKFIIETVIVVLLIHIVQLSFHGFSLSLLSSVWIIKYKKFSEMSDIFKDSQVGFPYPKHMTYT